MASLLGPIPIDMPWNSNSESQRQSLSPGRFVWRWPSNGTLPQFSPLLRRSRPSAGSDMCKAILWCIRRSITLGNTCTLCPARPVPSTGEKHSCDTLKIAQTCRSSIVVLNASSNISTSVGLCLHGIATAPPRFPLRHVSYRIIRLFLGAASETTYTVRHAEPNQPVRTPHTRGQQ
jgi:hypothetical protein